MQKHCSSCGARKPLDQFKRDTRRKDGRTGQCRACIYVSRATHAFNAAVRRRPAVSLIEYYIIGTVTCPPRTA